MHVFTDKTCLYSYPKEFWGNRARNHVISKGKSPLAETQRRFEPAILYHTGQWAQHTTDKAIPALLFKIFDILCWSATQLTLVVQELSTPLDVALQNWGAAQMARTTWPAAATAAWPMTVSWLQRLYPCLCLTPRRSQASSPLPQGCPQPHLLSCASARCRERWCRFQPPRGMCCLTVFATSLILFLCACASTLYLLICSCV